MAGTTAGDLPELGGEEEKVVLAAVPELARIPTVWEQKGQSLYRRQFFVVSWQMKSCGFFFFF